MKSIVFKSAFVFGFILLSSCTLFEQNDDAFTEPKIIPVDPLTASLIVNSNDFGLNLMKSVSAEEPGNLMISPLSASVNLAMLLNGTNTNTRAEILSLIGYPVDKPLSEVNVSYRELVEALMDADRKVTLDIANAIFYRNDFSFKAPFLAAMEDDFDASVRGLDFMNSDAVRIINKWAADNTNNKIPKVIDSIQQEMVMFIMNAVYFKGNWSTQFEASKTANKPFYVNPTPTGEGDEEPSISVPTMKGKVEAIVRTGEGFVLVELPYGRKNFSLTIVMPYQNLEEFIQNLEENFWNTLGYPQIQTVQSEWPQHEVELPKFSFSYEKVLNDNLKSLGMIDAFDPNRADLSGLSDAGLFVSFVKQNTFVEVNEQGTEAAAVTTTGIEVTSYPWPHIVLINRPFIYLIRERTTNTVLFMGKVVNPLETE
jgi:serpin B